MCVGDRISGNVTESFGNRILIRALTLTTYACLKAALHDVTIKKQTSKHDVTCKCTAMGRSSQRLLPVKCRCQMLTEVTTIGECFGLYIMSQFT